jgi:hypothetical protein
MVVRVAESLELPLRERNGLLLSTGYAPSYRESALDDPALRPVLAGLQVLLDGHRPFPAVIVDRYGVLIASNDSLSVLTDGIDPALLEPPVNVLRLALHPRGLTPGCPPCSPNWRATCRTGSRRRRLITSVSRCRCGCPHQAGNCG